jgi:hypothetical protein
MKDSCEVRIVNGLPPTSFATFGTFNSIAKRVILLIPVLISITGCGNKVSHARAGQIVKPAVYGQGGGSTSPNKTNIALYEYADKRKYVTTGKSIWFSIPEYFTTFSTNRAGGPQFGINLEYDPNENRPHIPSQYRSRLDWQRASTSVVGIILRTYEPRHLVSDEDIISGRSVNRFEVFTHFRPLERKIESYCGYTAYGPMVSTSLNEIDHQTPNKTGSDRKWTYGDAVVLARFSLANRAVRAVACSARVRSDGFPYCQLWEEYRGWPMLLTFSAARVCRLDDMIANTRAFLDRYVVSETGRAPGQPETRHSDSDNRSP